MILRSFAMCLAVVVATLMSTVACDSSATEPKSTPGTPTVAAPTSAPETGPTSDTLFEDVRVLHSLGELVDDSDLVVLATPLRRLDDYWPPVDPEIFVYSVYELRVDDVLFGEAKAGDLVSVYLEGGVKAESGNPQPGGSFRPRPGEPTVDAELPWWPRFNMGKQELLFLSKKPPQGTDGVLLAPGDGRYRVANGRIASLYVDVPTDPSKLSAGDYRRDVISTTVDELRAKVQATAAR
ncbi:MAG: hypothetical protein ACM3S1_00805 [Hyphomicrobiales bacterium]